MHVGTPHRSMYMDVAARLVFKSTRPPVRLPRLCAVVQQTRREDTFEIQGIPCISYSTLIDMPKKRALFYRTNR